MTDTNEQLAELRLALGLLGDAIGSNNITTLHGLVAEAHEKLENVVHHLMADSSSKNDLVHQVCHFLREEIEIATGKHSHCEGCMPRVNSPYGVAIPGCVLRAQQIIELVRGSQSETGCKCGTTNGVHVIGCPAQKAEAPRETSGPEGDAT